MFRFTALAVALLTTVGTAFGQLINIATETACGGGGTAEDSASLGFAGGYFNPASQVPILAFREDPGTVWLLDDGGSGTPSSGSWIIQWSTGGPLRRVEEYTLITGEDASVYFGRNPTSWNLFGSDGGAFQLIDSRSGVTWAQTNTEEQSFTVTSPAAYNTYRLDIITKLNYDERMVHLFQLQLNGYCTATAPTPGSGGDPHITSWSGARYDYHGHCDLLLLKSPHFGQGYQKQPRDQGLAIHIRSAPYRGLFSYISDIAIQIGDSILEIGSDGQHYIDGEPQQIGSTGSVAGYRVGSTHTRNGRYVFRVHLGDDRPKQYHGQEITVREYKDWITVGIHHAHSRDFTDSIGLMGSHPYGTWYGRDGVTVHRTINDFGGDWIVLDDVDGNLFREPSRFPDECEILSEEDVERRRRLDESTVTRAEARQACAHWPVDAVNDCVMDVLVADDLGMAELEY